MKTTVEACEAVEEFNRWNPIKGVERSSSWEEVQNCRDVQIMQMDASVLEEGIIGLWCVFKDQNKEVIFAACRKELFSVDVRTAESMAI